MGTRGVCVLESRALTCSTVLLLHVYVTPGGFGGGTVKPM